MLYLGFLTVVFLIYRYVLHDEDNSARYDTKRRSFELSDTEVQALELHFPFYQQLDNDEQGIFKNRLAYFLRHKRFVAHEGLDLFDAMKTLIAAEAIRITFGLKYFILPHFKVIRVFPQEYYSHVTKKYHKGEIDLRGSIALAWTSFQEGIIEPNDGLNVALHEFAHAVYHENFIRNKHYLFINPVLLREWNSLADLEMPEMKRNDDHFIRAYGSTNRDEFFAVSTEHFFEQPLEFESEHPELCGRCVTNVDGDGETRHYA